jgi:hypothetical protein
MSPLETLHRQKAGHYEILGETYAKFEFFEHGWNPYSRFLDVDKVDLILRRRALAGRVYREVQVKYGRLWTISPDAGQLWERSLFDRTSWRFFRPDEFDASGVDAELFIAYILAGEEGYRGDIFIFPVADFIRMIGAAIPISDGRRKVYISRVRGSDRWIVRRKNRFSAVAETTALDVTAYRRNFAVLEP